jgi:hypothetical protein
MVAGAVATGTWEGALLGGLTAGLFYGAGSLAQDWGAEGHALAHAGAGCLSAIAGGSSCGKGALSAGFADYAGGKLPVPQDQLARAMEKGFLGGVASTLAGGYFGGGFLQGLAGSVFNDDMHADMEKKWKDFEAHYKEIADANWNNPLRDVSVPGKPSWLEMIRQLFKWGLKAHMNQIDVRVYKQGIAALQEYRQNPGMYEGRPLNMVDLYGPAWGQLDWSMYDFGGTPRMTVDFVLWHGNNLTARPPDRYLGNVGQ